MSGVERPDQLVALELDADGVLELGEYEEGPGGIELRVELCERVGRGRVDVGDRFGSDDDPVRPRVAGGEAANLVSERPRVCEEQRRVEAKDHETGQLLGLRVQFAVMLSRHPRNATERGLVRPPRPPEHIEDRQRDSNRDPLENSEQRHAQKRRGREEELNASLTPQPQGSRQIGEGQRGGDHDGGERRVWQVL